MLRTNGQIDEVHSYNPLPTPWRGINKNKIQLPEFGWILAHEPLYIKHVVKLKPKKVNVKSTHVHLTDETMNFC